MRCVITRLSLILIQIILKSEAHLRHLNAQHSLNCPYGVHNQAIVTNHVIIKHGRIRHAAFGAQARY